MFRKDVWSLVMLALVGWSVWSDLGTKGDERASQGRAPVPPDSPSLGEPGNPSTGASAPVTVAVGSNRPGKVAQVFVRQPGAAVQAGDPLFQLDDGALRAELAGKQADLRLAEQQLAWLTPRRQEARILLDKDLEIAQATLALAKDTLERAQRSWRATAPQELVQRKSEVAIARSTVAKAEATRRLFALTWEQDTALAQARVDQAHKAVQKVRAELQQLTVTAPQSGVVLEVNVRVGETVTNQPGQALVRLGAVRKL